MSRRGSSSSKVKAINFVLYAKYDKPAEETSFDRFVAEKRIPEALWMSSVELRDWVRRNADRRYVPEYLLAAFDVRVNDKLSFFHTEAV